MITNLELDDELARKLESLAKARGVSLRTFIGDLLAQAAETSFITAPSRFTQKVHDFGAHVDAPWTLLAELESEEYILKYSKK